MFKFARLFHLVALSMLNNVFLWQGMAVAEPSATSAPTVAKPVQSAGVFDREIWDDEGQHRLLGRGRTDQCSKFVQEYAIIGMSRESVESLLGKAPVVKWGHSHTLSSYTIAVSCTSHTQLMIRYDQKKVDGYTLSDIYEEVPRFITTNVKPRANQPLYDFFNDNAVLDSAHMFGVPN
jgi:hypothetical protein